MLKIAVFASGNGTNAENLIKYFNTNSTEGQKNARVSLLICNKPDAYVITRATKLGVENIVLNREQLCTEGAEDENGIINILKNREIDIIVLAGYLLKIPQSLVTLYRDKIINIHPSLLPAYGGKGMYGERVHKAVLKDKKEKELLYKEGLHPKEDFYSGITIHLVDEEFDHGKILFQSKFILEEEETLESLEAKIHLQEQKCFPMIIETYLKNL